jgi:hypothetical protein
MNPLHEARENVSPGALFVGRVWRSTDASSEADSLEASHHDKRNWPA